MGRKIIFLVSLLIVFGCLFNFNSPAAKAMTTDEMIALIQKLQQQIADLQKQLAQAQGTQTVWCHDFNKNLSAGSNNEEVASLHTVLEKEGFDIFDEEKANKEFGESTASAISGFQQKYADEILTPLGLKYSTGILGKSTRAKLNKLFGCNVKATPRSFCSPMTATCEASAKIVCPAGLDDKGCPFPCKCVPVACAQEAKVCPNGTSVSRIAPSCEFAPCPDQTTNQTPIIYGIGGPTSLKVGETGNWTIKASDPEEKMLVYSVVWGDETVGAAQLSPLQPTSYVQTASFNHSYSKPAIYNPTFTVSDESGLGAKTSISVKVGEATSPLVSEQVKCLFKGSQTDQKCYGASSNYTNYSCSGTEGCVVDVKGQQGDKITWKSSCGGYAYTTIDGQNEYADFACGATSASLNVITPNGRDVWEISKAFEIKWKQTQNANVSVTVRNKQLAGTGGDLWFNMVVNGSVAALAGENRVWWDIPNYLNAHTGYEICVAGSFTSGTGQAIALEDCSDAPFAIHEATVSATAKTCSEMSTSQQYYFDICNKGGFNNVCFNKFSGIYQGCTSNIRNDCTEYNSNAQVNMLCSITGIPVPVPATPPTTQTPTPTTITPITPAETGVGVYRFEILDSQASCSCPIGTTCSHCLPASTYIIYTAKVSVYNEKGNFIASKDTSSGMAVFDNLAYGNYVAYFSAKGYQEDKIPFSVGPNFPTNNTSMLKKTAIISASNKSITVISPNGGENLLKGATYPIKWNSSNVDSVYIKLRKGADIKSADTYNGSEGEVSKIISNSGIFFWTVPSTLPDGNDYAIRIVDGTAVVLDDSDSLFSITAIPVATPTSSGGSESSQTTAVPIPIPATSTTPIPSTPTVQKTTGYTVPLNQIANILEAAQATINQISQAVNELLKNR